MEYQNQNQNNNILPKIKVTVGVPLLHKSWYRHCIQSVMQSARKANVIVKFQVIKENPLNRMGCGIGRNQVLEKLVDDDSDFFGWLDSDDMWHVDFLSEMIGLLNLYPDAIGAYSDMCIIDRNGKWVLDYVFPAYDTPQDLLNYTLSGCTHLSMCICGSLWRTKYVKDIRLDPKLKHNEDVDWIIQVASKNMRIVKCSSILYLHRHYDELHRIFTRNNWTETSSYIKKKYGYLFTKENIASGIAVRPYNPVSDAESVKLIMETHTQLRQPWGDRKAIRAIGFLDSKGNAVTLPEYKDKKHLLLRREAENEHSN